MHVHHERPGWLKYGRRPTTRRRPGPSSNGVCHEAVETTAFGLNLSPRKMSDVLQASCREMCMVESLFALFCLFFRKTTPPPFIFGQEGDVWAGRHEVVVLDSNLPPAPQPQAVSMGCPCLKPGNAKAASKLTTCSKDQHEGWAGPSMGMAYDAHFSVSALKSISWEVFFLLSEIPFQIAKEISLAAHILREGHVWLRPLPPRDG